MNALFLSALLVVASASFSNCGSSAANLPVSELYADPPGIVAAEQPITFRISFTVPNTTYIPSGLVEISSTWNGLPIPTVRASLREYAPVPLYGNTYTIQEERLFPKDVWGRIQVQMNVFNESGTQLLCAQWIAYATGTDKNETRWPLSVLYAA